jgi:hypothetical protein
MKWRNVWQVAFVSLAVKPGVSYRSLNQGFRQLFRIGQYALRFKDRASLGRCDESQAAVNRWGQTVSESLDEIVDRDGPVRQ